MSDQNAMLKLLYDNNQRLKQTETREVPGNVPGYTSFYDTGTFQPSLFGTGTAGTWTYGIRVGFYSRIGDRCFYNLFVQVTARSVAPTGNARITGLPFTSSATANSYSAGNVDSVNGYTLSGTIVQLSCRIPPSAAYIELIENNGTAPSAAANLAATGFGTASFIIISGNYMV